MRANEAENRGLCVNEFGLQYPAHAGNAGAERIPDERQGRVHGTGIERPQKRAKGDRKYNPPRLKISVRAALDGYGRSGHAGFVYRPKTVNWPSLGT